ncbi:hypothetical protein Pcinc_022369 [Petrolisthes cinctipes]|uniref:Uncharacterized protein n=1 Tax=Petrolisthes cinctipes TaxID=88211 RepID=A0AAE1KDT4_PETCI|nr:hypothetical protein Pcinc_022369 [Petrolisthes cinctipes]
MVSSLPTHAHLYHTSPSLLPLSSTFLYPSPSIPSFSNSPTLLHLSPPSLILLPFSTSPPSFSNSPTLFHLSSLLLQLSYPSPPLLSSFTHSPSSTSPTIPTSTSLHFSSPLLHFSSIFLYLSYHPHLHLSSPPSLTPPPLTLLPSPPPLHFPTSPPSFSTSPPSFSTTPSPPSPPLPLPSILSVWRVNIF